MSKQSNHPQNESPAQPPADERNIVAVGSDYEGATFEDRVYLLWNQYGRLVIAAIVAVVLFTCGWLFIGWFQERQEGTIAEAYRQAVGMDDKLAFAESHSGHVLAGVALLEVAQHHYEEGDFARAADLFGQAAASLGNAPTAGRAKIGRGISLALAGETEEALNHLEDVSESTANYQSDRVEAAFHAALLAYELGRHDTARRLLDRVSELDVTQAWAGRAMRIERRLPAEESAEEPVETPST